MFELPPFGTWLNWIYENELHHDVIHLTADPGQFNGRKIALCGETPIHFGNVSYLGLDTDPRLKNAAIEAIEKYGVQFSSSRSYVQLPLYEELESLLELMFGQPTIVTPSTTLGHMAAMPLFMHSGDLVLVDYQAHASLQTIMEIVRSKGAIVKVLAHNDMEALSTELETSASQHKRVWYVADGVYSMYGDAAPLGQLPALLERFQNLHLYIDDAHGMSWTGQHGTGFALTKLRLHPRMLLVTSLNKGFAAGGGAIVCPDLRVKNFLKRSGGSLVFGGPVQPGALAAGIESAKIHLTDEVILRQDKVLTNIRFFIEAARRYRIPLMDWSETPVFFVGVGKRETGILLCKRLREAGFYTNLGIFPAVPINRTGLRISIHHHLVKADIEAMLRTLAELIPMVLAEEKMGQRQMVESEGGAAVGEIAPIF